MRGGGAWRRGGRSERRAEAAGAPVALAILDPRGAVLVQVAPGGVGRVAGARRRALLQHVLWVVLALASARPRGAVRVGVGGAVGLLLGGLLRLGAALARARLARAPALARRRAVLRHVLWVVLALVIGRPRLALGMQVGEPACRRASAAGAPAGHGRRRRLGRFREEVGGRDRDYHDQQREQRRDATTLPLAIISRVSGARCGRGCWTLCAAAAVCTAAAIAVIAAALATFLPHIAAKVGVWVSGSARVPRHESATLHAVQ